MGLKTKNAMPCWTWRTAHTAVVAITAAVVVITAHVLMIELEPAYRRVIPNYNANRLVAAGGVASLHIRPDDLLHRFHLSCSYWFVALGALTFRVCATCIYSIAFCVVFQRLGCPAQPSELKEKPSTICFLHDEKQIEITSSARQDTRYEMRNIVVESPLKRKQICKLKSHKPTQMKWVCARSHNYCVAQARNIYLPFATIIQTFSSVFMYICKWCLSEMAGRRVWAKDNNKKKSMAKKWW